MATAAGSIAAETRAARILIVEDDPDWALLVRAILSEVTTMAFAPQTVECLADARQALQEGGVDCVLLDLSLPDASGLEALIELEGIAPDVPVVILSGMEDESLALRAVQSGAQDYLLKSNAEPGALTRAVGYAIERKRSEVDLAFRARHDPLTGLPNRAFFLERLEVALARSSRRGLRVAVLFLDLDGFKLVNDEHGHDMGDRALTAVAARLQAVIRPTDTLARFGGDEFVLLCEDLETTEDVVSLAERVGARMAAPFEFDGKPLTLGLSVGIVFARGAPGITAEALIRDADRMMYRAKRHARPFELLEAIEH